MDHSEENAVISETMPCDRAAQLLNGAMVSICFRDVHAIFIKMLTKCFFA